MTRSSYVDSADPPSDTIPRYARYITVLVGALVVAALYAAQLYNYLLFHCLVEGFSIVVACGTFMIAYNTRRLMTNHYLLFAGIAYLFVALIDTAHTLSYEGMQIFRDYGPNLPTQLWIAARYLEAASLLAAPLFLRRRLNPAGTILAFLLGAAVLFGAIFAGRFPDCFVADVGLTPFKRASEYLICGMLVAAAWFLYQRREQFERDVLRLILLSVATTIVSEIMFTLYADVYGLTNFTGHVLKLLSFYLLYRALIHTGLSRPFALLFRQLKSNELELREARDRLEERVRERTAALQAEIASRITSERELAESEEKYRNLFETMAQGVVYQNAAGEVTSVNPATEQILGASRAEILQQGSERHGWPAIREDGTEIPPEAQPAMVALHSGSEVRGELMAVYNATEAEYRWIRVNAMPLLHDRDGVPTGVYSTFDDITPLKRAEEERRKLEDRLAQAQKLESVGRLAGGVAHDFNNGLSVILGNIELAMETLDPADEAHSDLEVAKEAAQHAAELTGQLLAFARKQTIAPRILDLNETVAGTLKMLRRLIGENIDLQWTPAEAVGPVRMDPMQVDQILTNLAVNSRDAIADLGRISIETIPVEIDEEYSAHHPECIPGWYTVLVVSDTGSGMDRETLANIFEPFFTTKAAGRGTGLGLATVYGIVKQNNGFINVYSEPGEGTTFRMYFPCVDDKERKKAAEAATVEPARGTETVLLVEDVPALLTLTKRQLERLGYTVLAAGTPEAAIQIADERAADIHLLITDVVMPGMNGRDLYEAICRRKPSIRCLFMSGYTANVIAHKGVLGEGVRFLQKPFTVQMLSEKIREVLREMPLDREQTSSSS